MFRPINAGLSKITEHLTRDNYNRVPGFLWSESYISNIELLDLAMKVTKMSWGSWGIVAV